MSFASSTYACRCSNGNSSSPRVCPKCNSSPTLTSSSSITPMVSVVDANFDVLPMGRPASVASMSFASRRSAISMSLGVMGVPGGAVRATSKSNEAESSSSSSSSSSSVAAPIVPLALNRVSISSSHRRSSVGSKPTFSSTAFSAKRKVSTERPITLASGAAQVQSPTSAALAAKVAAGVAATALAAANQAAAVAAALALSAAAAEKKANEKAAYEKAVQASNEKKANAAAAALAVATAAAAGAGAASIDRKLSNTTVVVSPPPPPLPATPTPSPISTTSSPPITPLVAPSVSLSALPPPIPSSTPPPVPSPSPSLSSIGPPPIPMSSPGASRRLSRVPPPPIPTAGGLMSSSSFNLANMSAANVASATADFNSAFIITGSAGSSPGSPVALTSSSANSSPLMTAVAKSDGANVSPLPPLPPPFPSVPSSVGTPSSASPSPLFTFSPNPSASPITPSPLPTPISGSPSPSPTAASTSAAASSAMLPPPVPASSAGSVDRVQSSPSRTPPPPPSSIRVGPPPPPMHVARSGSVIGRGSMDAATVASITATIARNKSASFTLAEAAEIAASASAEAVDVKMVNIDHTATHHRRASSSSFAIDPTFNASIPFTYATAIPSSVPPPPPPSAMRVGPPPIPFAAERSSSLSSTFSCFSSATLSPPPPPVPLQFRNRILSVTSADPSGAARNSSLTSSLSLSSAIVAAGAGAGVSVSNSTGNSPASSSPSGSATVTAASSLPGSARGERDNELPLMYASGPPPSAAQARLSVPTSVASGSSASTGGPSALHGHRHSHCGVYGAAGGPGGSGSGNNSASGSAATTPRADRRTVRRNSASDMASPFPYVVNTSSAANSNSPNQISPNHSNSSSLHPMRGAALAFMHQSAGTTSPAALLATGASSGSGSARGERAPSSLPSFAAKLSHKHDVVVEQAHAGLHLHKRVRAFLRRFADLQQLYAVELGKITAQEKAKLIVASHGLHKMDGMDSCLRAWMGLFDKMDVLAQSTSTFASELKDGGDQMDRFYIIGSSMVKDNEVEQERVSQTMLKVDVALARERETARNAMQKVQNKRAGTEDAAAFAAAAAAHNPGSSLSPSSSSAPQFLGTSASSASSSSLFGNLMKSSAKGGEKTFDKRRDAAMKAGEVYSAALLVANERHHKYHHEELPIMMTQLQSLEELRLHSLGLALSDFSRLQRNHSQVIDSISSTIESLSANMDPARDMHGFVSKVVHEHGPALEHLPFTYDFPLSLAELKNMKYDEPPSTLFYSSMDGVMKHQRMMEGVSGSTAAAVANAANSMAAKTGGNGSTWRASLELPLIVPTLLQAIYAHNGFGTEGIFRISVSSDELTRMRRQLERGDFALQQSSLAGSGSSEPNPHVPAALLKSWFRDLLAPLFPYDLYAECVACGEMEPWHPNVNQMNANVMNNIMRKLPIVNEKVAALLIGYLKRLAGDQQAVKKTRMNMMNLALVFSPGLVRSEKNEPMQMLNDTKHCTSFLLRAIECSPSCFSIDAQRCSKLLLDQIFARSAMGAAKTATPTPAAATTMTAQEWDDE